MSGSPIDDPAVGKGNWRRLLTPSVLLLVIGSIFGAIYIALIPPGFNPDEVTHFTRAAQLGEGGLVAHGNAPGMGAELAEGVGGEVPSGIQDLFTATRALGSDLPSWQAKAQSIDWATAKAIPTNTPLETVAIGGGSSYSPVTYIPSTAAFLIGELLSLPLIVTFYLGRVLSLITGLFLTWTAIKLIPRGKWVLLVVGLLPTTLIQFGAISSDTMSFGLSFLAIGLTLRIAFQDQSVRWRQWLLLALIFLALGLSKAVCITLIPLLVAIPLCNNHVRSLRTVLKLIGVAAFGVCGVILWQSLLAGTTNIPGEPNPIAEQNSFILDHPILFVKTLIYTFFGSVGLPHEWISSFFGSGVSMSVGLPTIFLVALSGILMLSPLINDPQESPWRGTIKTRTILSLGFITIFLAFCIAAAIGIYSAWSLPRATVADGLQGRYFIPIAPVLLIAFLPIASRSSELQFRLRTTTVTILITSSIAMAWQIWMYVWRGGLAAQWPI